MHEPDDNMDDVPGKLHGRKTPPGLEQKILRKMPLMFVAATVITVSLSVIARLMPANETSIDAAKQVATVDIFVMAAIATIWTALITVTIGCVIVHIMKGPAYVADAYPLDSADQPKTGTDED